MMALRSLPVIRPTYRIRHDALLHVLDRRPSPSELDTLASSLGTALHRLEPGIGTFAVAYFLGQCAHESGEFKWAREIWGPSPVQRGYARRRDLQGAGVLWPGIGRFYRGGGWIQTTGRQNYRQAVNVLKDAGIPVESAGWLARNAAEPMVASLLAAAWWAPRFPTNMSGRDWTVERITRMVNGGLNGLESRRRYTQRALEARSGLKLVKV